MPDPTLETVFGLPFDEQIAFFRQKVAVPTDRWTDLWQEEHDRAFMVAGAAKADLLADLKSAVDAAIANGTGLDQFRRDFDRIVARRGWTGWTGEGSEAGVAWRTRTIWQTNLSTSYAAGRWQQLTDPELAAERPYWRYHHADGLLNPRPLHVAWDGRVLPQSHPFWATHFPPNGWGCHCWVSAATADDYAAAQAAGRAEPPADWDAIDTKTGAPRGIDKGFAYAPGASVADELREALAQKRGGLPPKIAESLDQHLAALPKAPPAPSGPVFVEAKTVKAAAKWAVDNGLADHADYRGITVEVANAWNRSLFDHLKEFPALRPAQKFVGTCQAQFARWREIEIDRLATRLRAGSPSATDADCRALAARLIKPKKVSGNTWAHSWAQDDVSGIAVNSKWGSDLAAFEAALVRNERSLYHPVGCSTVRSVVDHELGHQLDDLLDLHVDAEVVAAYNEAKKAGMTQEVSEYAGKNIKEFIAECWAESLNNPAPRDFARRIAEIVRRRYAARYP